jgi:sugar lactone lactonase YvrE
MGGHNIDCVWDIRCILGEGPLWDVGAQCLWFLDIKSKHIHRYNPTTNARDTFSAPEQIGFLAHAKDGFICGLQSGLHHFSHESGTFTPLGDPEPHLADNRLNDGMVDARGRLWFGTMHDHEAGATGALYRYDHRGFERMDDGYVITNGPCVSPDGRTLYHVDTRKKLIYAFDMDDAGALSNKRIFVDANDQDGGVDGIVCDCAGRVWVALFGGWGIRVYDSKGVLEQFIKMPVSNITKVAFGGADLKTVYVTTAQLWLSDEQKAQQPLAGSLFCFESDVAGMTAHRFGGQ